MTAAVRGTVRTLVHEHVVAGRVKLTEAPLPPEVEGTSFDLVPANQHAARVSLTVTGDTVAVTVGNGHLELWHDSRADWLSSVEEILMSVSEGRYWEGVREGWVFERRVDMHFSESWHARYSNLTYEDGEAPALGEHRYEPW
jgi:hypothetical protein